MLHNYAPSLHVGAVVDALGPAVRKEMIAWFSNWQFAPYKHTFQPYGECGSLEKTELRYAWLKQLLRTYEESFASLFPSSWRLKLAAAPRTTGRKCRQGG